MQVEIKTTLGTITVELDAVNAPVTVENFLAYTDSGFYAGTVFHRVIDGFMIQGGGFASGLEQKETHEPIRNEATNGLENLRGTLAMARTNDIHSATAQFFINFADNAFLDYKNPTPQGWGYAVFGEVVEGMAVIDQMATIPTGRGGPMPSDVPKTPIVLEQAGIIETAH